MLSAYTPLFLGVHIPLYYEANKYNEYTHENQ